MDIIYLIFSQQILKVNSPTYKIKIYRMFDKSEVYIYY
nr:hypothetical protein BN993_05347 [Virgibacillus halodenitrificans]